MKSGLVLAPLLLVLLLTVPAGALSTCRYTTSTATLQVGDGTGGTVYAVASKHCPTGSGTTSAAICVANTFVILEGNGLPGLQRWDDEVDDVCHGDYPTDLYVL